MRGPHSEGPEPWPRPLTGVAKQGGSEYQEGGSEFHGGLGLKECSWGTETLPCRPHIPRLAPLQGWGLTHPNLRNALFAQLIGRSPVNFLLRLVGPGKLVPPYPAQGSRTSSWPGLLNRRARAFWESRKAGRAVSAQAHPGLGLDGELTGLTPSGPPSSACTQVRGGGSATLGFPPLPDQELSHSGGPSSLCGPAEADRKHRVAPWGQDSHLPTPLVGPQAATNGNRRIRDIFLSLNLSRCYRVALKSSHFCHYRS